MRLFASLGWPVVCSASALALLLAGACRDPTQITVVVTTNAVCGDVTSTTVTVGQLGDAIENNPPAAKIDGCTDQATHTIGSVVLVPSGGNDQTAAFKVVAGIQKDAEQCTPPAYAGCIVARRALGYTPHTPLRVVVEMDLSCLGVPCNELETCANGKCVPASCTANGTDCPIDAGATDAPPGDGTLDGDPGGDACAAAVADDGSGVFVVAGAVAGAGGGGDASASCGSRASPCATIQEGLDAAQATAGKSIVYVARGLYAESFSLHANLRVDGGWDVVGAGPASAWIKRCDATAGAVVVRGTASAVATADGLAGGATLSDLTLVSKPPAAVAPGESLYGVFARGASTSVTLRDVVVDVGAGGAGASGGAGPTGQTAASCTTPGNGSAGTTAGAQGPGAAAGTFSQDGWAASAGQAGATGAPGANGAAGTGATCVPCGICTGLLCTFSQSGQSCGVDGAPGCGAAGGVGGGAGSGGGSSVAVFAYDAAVDVVGGELHAGDGGDGGSGGSAGAAGAAGAPGAGAAGVQCISTCALLGGSVCSSNLAAGTTGTGGQIGGAAAAGGGGGGGAGGASFVVVQATAAAKVTLSSSTLFTHGRGGNGGGPVSATGAAGPSGDRSP